MLERAVRAWLTVPRGQQGEALEGLLRDLPPHPMREEWNARFGAQSLYEAWARTTVARGIYAANARVLRAALDGRRGWRAVEVGGGNGALWREALRPGDRGELVVVDPVEEAHERVAAEVPEGVTVVPLKARIEEVELPEADAVVMSLVLHHVAGADAAERAAVGLGGPGKAEVLGGVRRAIAPRSGLALLNEADVYCDLGLPPGDPILADRIMDSYVRRTGLSLLDDLRSLSVDRIDLRERWLAILRHWCLEEIKVVDAGYADRDVYELDVPRWLALLARCGLRVESHGFSDPYGLFHQYVLRA